MSNETCLTGIWQGLYTYPRKLQRVLFGATLIESVRWVTGSTHEICGHGLYKGQTLTGILDGQRQVNFLTFTKTYDGNLRGYSKVSYEGTINEDETEIEGRWSIQNSWSGRFLMIRPKGKGLTVERKAFERI